MKFIIYLTAFIALSLPACAQQNMVPNGDFEYYTTCPTSISQTMNCTGWDKFTSGTSDYFNSCNGANASVPSNQFGYQPAASGQAYMGGYSFTSLSSASFGIYKEYVARQILTLQPGVPYEVSLSVNLSNNSYWGTDDIGVFFYKNWATPPIVTNTIPTGVVPQVTFTSYGPITDTVNWVRLVGTFIADSAYDHIVIGCFKDLANMDTASIRGGTNGLSYYHFDSIVVRVASKIRFTYSDTLLCAGDTFSLPYTVDTSFHPGTGNQFRVQLSNASGSFAAPTVIGSVTSGVGGTIFCTIPSATPVGNGYRIRIVSTNPADSSGNNGKNIGIGTLVAKPVAGSNSPVCTGSDINLFASTTTVSSALKWSWTGPAGFSSSSQNPTITSPTAANAGSYIVTASIYGCKAKDTTSVSIIALPAPTGIIATSNSPVCVNDTLKLFSTNSSPGTVYSWTGPNSFSAATQNTSIVHPVAAAAGDYIVAATLNGCSVKDTVTVVVKPTPAGFSAADNSPVCAGGSYSMNAASTSTGVTWAWTGPFGFTDNTANPSITGVTAVNAGDYIITATLNGCSLKDTLTLVVNPLPAKPVAGSNTPVCSGNTLNLSASTSTGGVAYSWTGPGSFTSSAQNPSRTNVTTAAAGDYVVTATITATGCAAKDTETVVVRPTPVVNATNNTPVCEGATVNLFSAATPTGTFAWSGPGSFTSSAQNPTITNASPAASGDYIVSVTLNGCTGKDTTTVTVKPNPITPLTGSNTPVCVGGTISLTAASNAGSTYSWTGPNSFSSVLQNPSRNNVVMADAGVYSVIATLNGCVSPAGSTTVVVNPAPFVTIYPTPSDSICQGNTVTFIALPANAGSNPSYKWTKNSSPSVLGTNNTLVSAAINNNDIIRCEMTETTKCGTAFKDTSNEVKMTVLPWLAPSVSISSNPTTPLSPNELITFTAIPVNAGNNPKYQWQRNSSDVVGATSAVWATQQLSNNDSISVILTSDYRCPQPKTAGSNSIKVIVLTGVDDVKGNNTISLYPNPNNGSFTIKGNVNSNKEVTIQIVNAVGQLVYETRTLPKNKELYEQVNVQHLASGIYILKIKTEAITYIKFKIE